MRSWFGPALALVAALTALRLAVLAIQPTDLFVDEAQYWLWGQTLDFGYFSKPPLVAWLIRATVEVAGSNAPFWVRAPAPLLHAATALILGAFAARVAGRRAAFWAAATYATLPFVSVGSLVISTDTVMAPFYAATLVLILRTAATHRATDGFAAGLALGFAFLAKYAALYLVPGLVVAAMLSPAFRPRLRSTGWMVLGFVLVAAPNVFWNVEHDMVTLDHTIDTTGWARTGFAFNIWALAEFWAAQALAFGPLMLAAFVVVAFKVKTAPERALFALALLPLLAVSGQALVGGAYANWALAAYFAATPLLVARAGRMWRILSLAINSAVGIALMALAVFAPWPEIGGRPLAARMLGRADVSQQILALAFAEGLPILAARRDILADLFYTGDGSGAVIWAPRREGHAANYYELTYPHPAFPAGPMLYVAGTPPVCDGLAVQPLVAFETAGGAYARTPLFGYVLPAECADAAD